MNEWSNPAISKGIGAREERTPRWWAHMGGVFLTPPAGISEGGGVLLSTCGLTNTPPRVLPPLLPLFTTVHKPGLVWSSPEGAAFHGTALPHHSLLGMVGSRLVNGCERME